MARREIAPQAFLAALPMFKALDEATLAQYPDEPLVFWGPHFAQAIQTLQAVGVILVIAMLIAPGITAFTLCRRFGCMLMVAVAVAVFSSVAGIMLSFFIDAASGPCIVIVQALGFVLAQTWSHCRTSLAAG